MSTYSKTAITSLIVLCVLIGGLFFSPFGTEVAYADDPMNQESALNYEADTKDFGCISGNGTDRIAGCVAAASYYILLVPTYSFAAFIGMAFNYALFELVVGMGTLASDTNMPGIMIAWSVLRDFANVLLVFITVYIGIATILGIASFNAKRLLWKVLLAALLVNFSVTITKFIIDVTNLAAVETYTMFINDVGGGGSTLTAANCINNPTAGTGAVDITTNPCLKGGISGAFWSQLKVTTVFDVSQIQTTTLNEKGSEKQWKMALTAVMAAMMFLVLAFVFGAATFLLIARFVLLIFLLIVSPVALVFAITGAHGIGRLWWKKLISQSLFAPLILLMWWVAYKVMDGFVPAGSMGGGITDMSSLGIIVYFLIVMGFLITALILANNFGAYGANASLQMGRRWARTAAYGAAGYVGANTAGRWAYNAADAHKKASARRFEQNEDGSYKDNTTWGRFARTKTGMKINRGLQGGLQTGAKTKFAKTKSFSERREGVRKATEAQQKMFDTENRKQALKSAMGSSDVSERKKAISKATANDLLEHKDDLRRDPSILAQASHGTYNKIIENKDNTFTDSEIQNFKDARKSHFKDGMNTEDVVNEIQTTGPKDLSKNDTAFFERDDVARNIDKRTMEGLVANGISKEKREALRNKVEDQHKDIITKYGAGSVESTLVDPSGAPLRSKLDNSQLTKEERNIVELHNWFNDDNKMKV